MRYKSSVFIVLLLHGCAAPVMFGVGATSIAVTETTGKSITDHVVSTAKEKDCRLWRYFKGDQVCQEVETVRSSVTVSSPTRPVVIDSNSNIKSYEEVLAKRRNTSYVK